MWEQAVIFATRYHEGQLYERKEVSYPYILHPLRVMGEFHDDFMRTVAVLHDVLEDTEATEEIIFRAFGRSVLDVLRVLTRGDHETYWIYLSRVASDRLASLIKLADVNDNLANCMSEDAPERSKSLISRYTPARKALMDAIWK